MKFGTRLKRHKTKNFIAYYEKYMKAKVRELNDVIKTNFLGDEIPKKMYFTLA